MKSRLSEHYDVAAYIADQLALEIPFIQYRRVLDNTCGWVSFERPQILNMNVLYQDIDCLTKPEIDHYTRVIAHEMAHMKQFITGKLEIKLLNPSTAIVYWEGKRIFIGDLGKTKGELYHNFPWEIEARLLENRLSNKYLNRGA